METWKSISGYEELYEVSNLGRVKRLKRTNGSGRIVEEKIIAQTKRKRDGRISVSLTKNGIQKSFSVHRLVALAFLENPYNLPEVNHKDENPQNNCADNLEWCNHLYNIMYGTRNKRIAEKNSREIVQKKDGVEIRRWKSMKEAGRNGYDAGSISLCCRGLASHHKGFQWKYAEQYTPQRPHEVKAVPKVIRESQPH